MPVKWLCILNTDCFLRKISFDFLAKRKKFTYSVNIVQIPKNRTKQIFLRNNEAETNFQSQSLLNSGTSSKIEILISDYPLHIHHTLF